MDNEKLAEYRARFDRLPYEKIYAADEITLWEEMFPSHDGVKLRTVFARPKKDGAYPTIVMRNCYAGQYDELVIKCEEFAMRGYGAVAQMCRGTVGSEGVWEPNVNDREDGLFLLNHLEKLDWIRCMGYQGASYLAFTGWVMADAVPSKMKSMFLTVYGTDRHTSAYKDGLFRQDILTAWAKDNAGRPVDADYMESAKYRPQVEVDEALWGGRLDWYRDWITNTSRSDPYWNGDFWKDLRDIPGKMNIPVFVGEGWYDHHLGSALNGFNALSDASALHSTLRIGPWNHGTQPVINGHKDAENAGSFELGEIFDWFHETLMEEKTPERKIRCYVIGADEWRDFPEYPFPVKNTAEFYLAEDGKLLKAVSAAVSDTDSRNPDSHQNGTGICMNAAGSVTYTYDPQNPNPSHGGESLFATWNEIGSLLQPEVNYRPDVVSFVSEPLEKDLTIIGRIEAELFVESDAEDTCFTMQLMEVFENGEAYNIRNGLTTLAYRNGSASRLTYEPNTVEKIRITSWDVAWQMKKGSRLRLDISSSNFPEYAVHPNKAGIWSMIRETVPAKQTVHFGKNMPSKVILPVE